VDMLFGISFGIKNALQTAEFVAMQWIDKAD
jgi:hypothetical protein